MPTLEEIRSKYLKRAEPGPTAVPDKTAGGHPARAHHAYKLDLYASDALMKVGKYHGKTLTQIAVSDPSYLNWLAYRSDFPQDLKDVARRVLDGCVTQRCVVCGEPGCEPEEHCVGCGERNCGGACAHG